MTIGLLAKPERVVAARLSSGQVGRLPSDVETRKRQKSMTFAVWGCRASLVFWAEVGNEACKTLDFCVKKCVFGRSAKRQKAAKLFRGRHSVHAKNLVEPAFASG